jgi:hypothetical protein
MKGADGYTHFRLVEPADVGSRQLSVILLACEHGTMLEAVLVKSATTSLTWNVRCARDCDVDLVARQ